MTPYITRQMLSEMVGTPTHRSAAPLALPDRLQNWLGRVIKRWQRNRMISALHSLDDRLLDDIGLCRADIPQMAEAHFQGGVQQRPFAPNMPPRGRRMLA